MPRILFLGIIFFLEELSKEDAAIVFRLLPKNEAADIFAYIEPDTQERLVNLLSDKEISDIISNLFVDDAADLIEEMPAGIVTRILSNIKPEKRKAINELLQYPEDSAGSIMTTDFIDIHSGSTVKDIFDKLRKVGKRKEAGRHQGYPRRVLKGQGPDSDRP